MVASLENTGANCSYSRGKVILGLDFSAMEAVMIAHFFSSFLYLYAFLSHRYWSSVQSPLSTFLLLHFILTSSDLTTLL